MKNNDERINSINVKVKDKKRKRNIWLSATASALCLIAVFTVVCSVPILSDFPERDISAYKRDSYYPLISKLNSYDNYGDYKYSVFDKIFNLGNKTSNNGWINDAEIDSKPTPPETDDPSGSNKYEETTLNQVDGVVEGDILKRTTENVFYLKRVTDRVLTLNVYGLDGAETRLVTTYKVMGENGMRLYFDGGAANEMYLSSDGKVLTIVTASKTSDDKSDKAYVLYTTVISLDVSDVNDIKETGRKYVSGRYLSSRKVDGKLLVITNFNVSYSFEFGDKHTYVPSCGDKVDDYLEINDIYLPDRVTARKYTVLAELDENSLAVDSCRALLSYSNDVFVSKEHIFVTRSERCYYDGRFSAGGELSYEDIDKVKSENVVVCFTTDIVTLDYKNGLATLGCVKIDGSIENRYSMDEKDGILRVFATTNRSKGHVGTFSTNVSLYCVDLTEMKVVSSVESFAPNGDEVKSARFDGDIAWVCTALRNTDPVYRFDLTDVYNIPAPIGTNEIPGFSTSLVAFGDDTLLGIGEDNGDVKIEMYRQTGGELAPVAAYKAENCSYSYLFKAYFIDVEHNLIGLGIYDRGGSFVTDEPNKPYNGNKYLLLKFNAETQSFEIVFDGTFDTGYDHVRAFYLDDAVYLFGNGFLYIKP